MDHTTDQNQPGENLECLVILGMHRSGGALLAGCLHHMGFNLGGSLTSGHGADEDNAFQNQDIVLAHEIFLRDLGCRWDMVGSLPEGWAESQAAVRLEKKLIQIIEQQFLGRGPWTIRDPRLCRVLHLWLKVLAKLEITPGFVHLVRHPYEVACSLQQHHAIEIPKSHLLWLVYHRDALEASRRHPHTLLTYDQLLADPVTALLKIASTLGLELPRDPLQFSRVLTDFARPDLKHHHTNGNGDRSSHFVFAQFAWIYEQFRLAQAKALNAPNDGPETSNSDALSDFPLAVALDSAPQAHAARGHATAMFNNLLEVIGRFEQTELDQDRQRQRRLLAAAHVAETLYVQVYFPLPEHGEQPYREEASHKMLLAPNEWQPVVCDIPRPEDLHTGRLRLDLLNTRGSVSVSSIKLFHAVTGEVFWVAEDVAQFAQCAVEGDSLVLPDAQNLVLVCTGNDARLCLPLLPDLPDCPLQLKVWIKVSQNQNLLKEAWNQLDLEKSKLDNHLRQSQALFEETRQKAQSLRQKLAEKTAAFQAGESEWKAQEARQKAQIEILQQQRKKAEQALQILQREAQVKSDEQAALLEEAQVQESEFQHRLENLENQLRDRTAALQQKEAELQKQETHHQSQIETLKEKWQVTSDQLTARLKEAQQQKADGIARIQDLQEKLRVKEVHIQAGETEQREQGRRHQQQIATLESTITDQDHTIAALEKQHRHQKELSLQYYQALQGTEEIHQNRIDTLENQARQREADIERLEKHLNDQDSIIAHQRGALIDAEQETATNRQLNAWMQDLRSLFQALAASRRWKFGHAAGRTFEALRFRSPRPTALDQIYGIFGQFDNMLQPEIGPPSQTTNSAFHDGEVLISWMQQLQGDFHALVGSHRWRWGNAMVCMAEKLLLRRKVLLAPAHMAEIFAQFEDWHQNGLSGRSGGWLSHDEICQLDTWLNVLEQDFRAILACRRWRLGSAMVRIVKALSFRRQAPLVTEHMNEIFEDFRNQYPHPS